MNNRFLALAGLAVGTFTVVAQASAAPSCCPSKAKPAVETVVNAKQVPAKTKLAKGEFASISTADLKKAIAAKKVVVIDVNGTDSYKAGRIPTAINFEQTKNLKAKLPANKSALVVAYCGSEYCGAYKQAAEAATKLGYTNVVHYSPGIKGWKAAGEAIEKG